VKASEKAMAQPITVFRARAIITMEPSLPRATAVAVRDGLILSVGSWEDMQPWLKEGHYVINDDFCDDVLMPGFIDTHVHPLLGAFICASIFLTPFSWDLPWEQVPALETADAYRHALTVWVRENAQSPILVTWGYHESWHGKLSRQYLDSIAPHTPLIVWHLSSHEFYVNSAALEQMQLPDEIPAGINPQHVDRAQGHFFETGAFFAGNFLKNLHLHDDQLFQRGMQRFFAAVHAGGITTMADMATGLFFDIAHEVHVLRSSYVHKPFRLVVTPDVKHLIGALHDPARVIEELTRVMKYDADERVFFGNHVKLFADGAFFSQNMRMGPPGFLDGHHGAWIMMPDEFRACAAALWHAGYQIHVHVNGDEGVEMILETVAALQRDHPRIDHRFTLEHCGYATEDQILRCGTLGILISAQVYYIYALADDYAAHVLGADRAARMCALGSMVRHNIPISLHSDFPVAPLNPLLLAHIAHTRTTQRGTLMCPHERLSKDEALRAVTIDAAYILRLEHMIGSVCAGKKADFVILDKDPYQTDVSLQDIGVRGTIVDGISYRKGMI
jgi:predicted amidohydrolase YtcJ